MTHLKFIAALVAISSVEALVNVLAGWSGRGLLDGLIHFAFAVASWEVIKAWAAYDQACGGE